jgi:hypothetical protein
MNNIREVHKITDKCKNFRGGQKLCHFSLSLEQVGVSVRDLVFYYARLQFTANLK